MLLHFSYKSDREIEIHGIMKLHGRGYETDLDMLISASNMTFLDKVP